MNSDHGASIFQERNGAAHIALLGGAVVSGNYHDGQAGACESANLLETETHAVGVGKWSVPNITSDHNDVWPDREKLLDGPFKRRMRIHLALIASLRIGALVSPKIEMQVCEVAYAHHTDLRTVALTVARQIPNERARSAMVLPAWNPSRIP
jgi:hypothetical protein